MALTIEIEGKGVIANCDQTTNDTGGTGTDDWLELGGGSITDQSDAFLYGTTSIGSQYASKDGMTYFNMGTPLDFDTAGDEEGQFIYIWLNMMAPTAFDTIANKGFAIRIGSSTTDYRDFVICGEDDNNGWFGGWKLFVIDPTLPGTVTDTGTFDVGAVNLIGIWVDTNVSVRSESIFIDQIAVGNGLRITGTWDSGTYSGAWEEVLAYCTDFPNRAWGMLQERDGVYYAFGKFWIGDSTQSVDTVFADSGKVIQFGTTQYYYSGGWVTTMPTDACGIVVEDSAGNPTTFDDGVIVGSDKGRSGSTFIGNDDQDISLDLYGGNNAGSLVRLYGTQFVNCTGLLNMGDDAQHLAYSAVFDQCSQFDPVGAPILRNCSFINTVDVDSSLLWNESINIQYCNFISNTTGAAIEHDDDTSSPYSHVGLQFDGNTDDVLNSSGQPITINNSGNPSANGASSEGSAVTFLTAIDLIVTVQDTNTDPIENAQVAIYKISDRSQLMNEDTLGTGIAQQAYNGGATDIEIRVRKSSTGDTKYRSFSTLGVTGGSDYTLLVTLEEDTIAV